MDNPEPQPNLQPVPVDSQDQYDSLHNLVFSMLCLLTLLAVIVTVFLWRQQSEKGFELGNFSIQANNFMVQFDHAAAQQEFIRKLTEYGRSHSDLAPILTKFAPLLEQYGFRPSSVAPIATPATSASPPQKK